MVFDLCSKTFSCVSFVSCLWNAVAPALPIVPPEILHLLESRCVLFNLQICL